MKVGDRLYCIKNATRGFTNNGEIYSISFKRGGSYCIYHILGEFVYLNIFVDFLNKFMVFKFHKTSKQSVWIDDYLPEHFITEQEVRKLKLTKLNDFNENKHL